MLVARRGTSKDSLRFWVAWRDCDRLVGNGLEYWDWTAGLAAVKLSLLFRTNAEPRLWLIISSGMRESKGNKHTNKETKDEKMSAHAHLFTSANGQVALHIVHQVFSPPITLAKSVWGTLAECNASTTDSFSHGNKHSLGQILPPPSSTPPPPPPTPLLPHPMQCCS